MNGVPGVDISAPAEGATFPVNTAVTFSATASDPEDGDLTAGIRWTSDPQRAARHRWHAGDLRVARGRASHHGELGG